MTFTNIPTEPTPNIVLVKNIAPNTSEKTVKDFFLFCGKIQDFQLHKDADGVHQTAFVYFERESAAKTAALLTNALIDDSHITVEPYFKDASVSSHDDSTVPEGQESKAKSNVVVELLASGYVITDQVIEKALDFDHKYGVSTRVQQYLKKLQETALQLDSKYKVSETVGQKSAEIDAKYHVVEKATEVQHNAEKQVNTALAHPIGQKVQSLVSSAQAQVLAVHEEAKKLAEQKKQTTGGSTTAGTYTASSTAAPASAPAPGYDTNAVSDTVPTTGKY